MIDLAISNIAWSNDKLRKVLPILVDQGITKIELSLNKIYKEPINEPISSFVELKKNLDYYNIEVVATHSLFYTMKKFNLFDVEGYEKLNDYLVNISKIIELFNAKNIIFGSGSCRNIKNFNQENDKIFYNFLFDFLKKTNGSKTNLLIEPLSKIETNFINNCSDAMKFIKQINCERVSLHIDLKSSMYEKEDLEFIFKNYFKYINHIHISDEDLYPPSKKSGYHHFFSNLLHKYNYSKCVSIEMKEINPWSTKKFIDILNFVQNTYLT